MSRIRVWFSLGRVWIWLGSELVLVLVRSGSSSGLVLVRSESSLGLVESKVEYDWLPFPLLIRQFVFESLIFSFRFRFLF